MSDLDSKIWETMRDVLNEGEFRNEAHELIDSMSDEQIAKLIPYLKSLL